MRNTTTKPDIDEDAQLMQLAAQGSSSAFETLYRKYLPLVSLYLENLGCRQSSIPDLAQEVFARLWARRRQYAGESKLKTYILGYANKVLLEECRRQRRTRRLADHFCQDLPHAVSTSATPEMAAEYAEWRESLDGAILRLTVGQQEALRLYYVEQMSLEKAAHAAGCTKKCFASRLLRARRVLQGLMKDSR